jgi:hypothetical protein
LARVRNKSLFSLFDFNYEKWVKLNYECIKVETDTSHMTFKNI